MRQKRAAVLRVLEASTGRSMTAEQVEAIISERGLLTDDELAAGTPIRIVMAKLAVNGALARIRPGVYKLAAEAASENGTVHRVQTGEPTSSQKPPPEEVASLPEGLPFEAMRAR
jgi:predicted transcriptional regulator of viral defense system